MMTSSQTQALVVMLVRLVLMDRDPDSERHMRGLLEQMGFDYYQVMREVAQWQPEAHWPVFQG